MAISKAKKAEKVELLKKELATSTTAIIGTFAKLTVAQDFELRKVVREAGGKYRVVKEGWSIIATADMTVQPPPGVPPNTTQSYSEAEQSMRAVAAANPAKAGGLRTKNAMRWQEKDCAEFYGRSTSFSSGRVCRSRDQDASPYLNRHQRRPDLYLAVEEIDQ